MTLPVRYVPGVPSPRGPQSELPGVYERPAGDLTEIVRKMRRHMKLIVGSVIVCTIVAAIVVVQIQPRYSAVAQVMVGVPEANVFNKSEAVMKVLPPDSEIIRNESYVMASPAVAQAAIDQLGLDRDPEFNPYLRESTLWGRVTGAITDFFSSFDDRDAASTGKKADGFDRRKQAVVDTVLSKLDVEPIARSYILSVQADSFDPVTAAKLANAIAGTYVKQQRDHKWQATHDAELYLKKRIDEMRKEVAKTDKAVEDYRRRTGLLKGATTGVTEQQLTELNTQLIMAQAAKAEADSRLRDAQGLAKRADASETIPEVLRSPTVQALKQQQVEVERKIAEYSSTYGERHPKMINARNEAEEVRRKFASRSTESSRDCAMRQLRPRPATRQFATISTA